MGERLHSAVSMLQPWELYTLKVRRGLPQGLGIHLAMQGVWVRSLVRELGFHKLQSNYAHVPNY